MLVASCHVRGENVRGAHAPRRLKLYGFSSDLSHTAHENVVAGQPTDYRLVISYKWDFESSGSIRIGLFISDIG